MEQTTISFPINKARIIGTLFLSAFLLYGIGRHLFESEVWTQKYMGASLILLNSIAVLFIGIFLRKSLVQFNHLAGNIYLFARTIEAIGLISIVWNLLPNISVSLDYGYFIAMLFLGLGSIPMCSIFYKHQLLPKWLALWGIIGYSLLAFGFFMELLGQKWSMYLLILGGLWEIVFAIWLILKAGRKQ